MLVYQLENHQNERMDIGEWLGFVLGGEGPVVPGGVGHECMTTAEIGPRGLQPSGKGPPRWHAGCWRRGMGLLVLALRIIGMRYVVWLELHHCMAPEAPLCG